MGPQRLLARLLLVILLAAGRTASAEQKGKPLRLGYFPNLTHAQALYARATGAFEKVGARIQWVAFNAGPTAVEALFTDAVDATFVGPSPTINGYVKSRGDKFVVVAGSASGGAGLVVRGDAGITTEKDFGDKIIATPQLGNTQDVAARVWLAEQGDHLRERGGNLSLVPLSNADQLTMKSPAVSTRIRRLPSRETGKPLKAVVIQKAMTRIELTWDPICSSVKKSAEASHRIGFLRAPPRLDGLYSLSLLNEVLKEKNLTPVAGLSP